MRKECMNSYAKFGGAARRHFTAICKKTDGGHICVPPAVRGGIYTMRLQRGVRTVTHKHTNTQTNTYGASTHSHIK